MGGNFEGSGGSAEAARLAVAAGALAAPGGAPFDPIDQLDREEIEADIKAALSDDEWQEALDEGRAIGLDEAIDCALKEN